MADDRASMSENPLLTVDGFPAYDKILPSHIEPAVRDVLQRAGKMLDQLESDLQATDAGDIGWSAVSDVLDEIGELFERSWSPVPHLLGVANSDALREAYEGVLGDVVAFSLRSGQSQPIFAALTSLRNGEKWETLDDAQRRIVADRIHSARLSGIELEGETLEEFNAIEQELSELSTQFSNNVLDANKAFSLDLMEDADVTGLPPSLLHLAAQAYNVAKGEDGGATAEAGPWRITLDVPVLMPFLQHSRRRDLREQLYQAHIRKASADPHDNAPHILRILELRQRKAKLLGFETYAELSLSTKMADSVPAVESTLEQLRQASWDTAHRELDELRELARDSDGIDDVKHWDVAFYAERLREQRFEFTDEELRPYFSLEVVLDGMFSLAERLFGVTVDVYDGDAPVWHEDVRVFEVRSEDNPIAYFYLDPYSRPEDKRGGAWMSDCLGRRVRLDGSVQLPVAHLICNATPPVGDRPSLMTFREVETLFHEFGHGLQHMLTEIDYADAAGINGVEWDAVELPSQFMENWCYHRPTLMSIARHHETGAPLPNDLFEKICAARTYRAGSLMLRQLMFGLTDLELHHRFRQNEEDAAGRLEALFDVPRRIAETTSTLPVHPDDRSLCSFQHIFAGGYAAGYYSYKWAEVLSADAFSAFEDAGLDDDAAVAETGQRFRKTVLAQGGARHPMEIFCEFRGREPSPDALLRHSGLLDAAQ